MHFLHDFSNGNGAIPATISTSQNSKLRNICKRVQNSPNLLIKFTKKVHLTQYVTTNTRNSQSWAQKVNTRQRIPLSAPSFSYVCSEVLGNKPIGSNLIGPHAAEERLIVPHYRNFLENGPPF